MIHSVYGFLLSIVLLSATVSAAPLVDNANGLRTIDSRPLSPRALDILSHARKVEPSKSETKVDSAGKDNGKKPKKAPPAPHWVVYADTASGSTAAPPASDIEGFNVLYAPPLAFSRHSLAHSLHGPWDKAREWFDLTAEQRASIKSEYAAAGIKLIVSVFGLVVLPVPVIGAPAKTKNRATDVPTSSGADPIATAATMAKWVKDYNLDGIDVDYEDFNAFDAGDGSAENWLIDFTKALRADLPAPDFLLTHAPVAPWFTPDKYAGGGYLKVHEEVGDQIDWYNLQFYNQGLTEYTTCEGLLTTSSATWPKTALFQIADSGVPLDKLVIGKPARASGDSNNGYIAPEVLATCVATAKAKGWQGGVMVWQYPYATEDWISTVRGASWPV